jgi:beta-glucosidase-like glycosyl hydrolase
LTVLRFGEDGYLIGEFGRVYVETMEEKDENGYTKVACTIKHFVYGDARGGVNTASQYGGINHLFNDQLRPYIHVLETTSPASLMVSYATVDLVPMSANEYMLQDILRDKLGFKGLIMSDAFSIPNLYTQSKTATSLEDAALQALNAGLQMELAPGNPPAFPTLISGINDTRVAKLIDAAVLKMLEIKYASGVFEQPLANLNVMNKTLRAAAHLDLARQMARESIVLLKNDGLLPYPLKGTGKLAIIGPFGDILNPGSYAAVNVSDARYGSSLYRSAVSAFGADRVTFTQGCDIVDTTNATNSIPDAVTAAKEAGFAVLMLGSLSDAPEDMTMAPKRTDGEFFAHADLGFPGLQQELLDAILDPGVPTVLILTGGQPFVLQQSTLSRVNAIFHSFLGGEFTGDALIELLTGRVNPSAKLTISMPQHTGATPAMYDYLPSDDQGGWASLGYQSAWQFPNLTRTVPMPFGFGLSYTTFDISTPIATVQEKNKAVVVATTVRNTGTRKGKEVVQVYFRPATTRGLEFPVKRLVRFEKVELPPGESRDVNFNIPYKDLGVWINAKPTTFMGLYNIWVGSSSREEDLTMVNVTLV